MAKIKGVSAMMKTIIGISVAVVVWAILGYGVGLETLFNTTATHVPTTIQTLSTTLVGVGAAISVVLGFFE